MRYVCDDCMHIREEEGRGERLYICVRVCVCERKQFNSIDNLLHRGQKRFLIMPSANVSINPATIVLTKRYAVKREIKGN